MKFILIALLSAMTAAAAPTATQVSSPGAFELYGVQFVEGPLTPTFQWEPSAGATQYTVQISDNRTDFSGKHLVYERTLPPPADDVPVINFVASGVRLQLAKTYYWRVYAEADGVRTGGSPFDPSAATFAVNLFRDFHLQRSFISKEIRDGAAFSLTKAPSTNVGYNADFALVYNPLRELEKVHFFPDQDGQHYDDHVHLFAALEGHVNSDPSPKVSQHNLLAEIGLDELKNWSPRNVPLDKAFSTYSRLTFRYESSQRGDVQKALASLRVYPIYQPIAIESIKTIPDWQSPGGEDYTLGFWHEESLGFDAGGTTRGQTKSLESDNGVFRLVAHVRPEVRLNFLRGVIPFNPKNVSLYADDTFMFLTTENRGVNFLTTGVNVDMTDNVGIQVYYKVGRAEPVFQKVESINVGLSAKF